VKRRRQTKSPREVQREVQREVPRDQKNQPALKMFLVPCSCGTTFAVAENYDRQGTAWGRYLPCPSCGKRHDPKNRLLQMGYQRDGFWKVDEC
jgi:hydrogenase maturation factor HypF (carbamoyltransferase family)